MSEITASTRVVADLPHHCNGCVSRWNGFDTCHCSRCHLTFIGIRAFDLHRRGGRCLQPMSVGLVGAGRRYECWGHPGKWRFSVHGFASDGSGVLAERQGTGEASNGSQISRVAS
ncbi:hypothetical protein [Mycobacterium senriense]|nr:hypothetical protein [Mycobacterium senriense]